MSLAQLALTIGVLGLLGLIASRFGLSAIPAYLLAGLLLGPNEPRVLSLIEPSEVTEFVAKVGLVFLLFFLGLEFTLGRLARTRRHAFVGGAVDFAVNAGVGLVVGVAAFGLSFAALILASAIYVSSSAVTVKGLIDFRRLADDETDLVLAILVAEDVVIALVLGFAAGGGADAPETMVAIAEELGLSEAIGALMAGVVLSETSVRPEIEERFFSFRDVFAALFFFVFGLSIDISAIGDVGWILALAVVLTVAGKVGGGYLAGAFGGFSPRQSFNAGVALIAHGEFTIILAQLASENPAISDADAAELVAFAGLYVLATASIGIVLMKESKVLGRRLFRPPRLIEGS
jgi:CPA2 family monovalent cation:H+ antiporter-2